MSERPPEVDLSQYRILPTDNPALDSAHVFCHPLERRWLRDMDAVVADLEATRRERDELEEQADKVYLLLQSAVAKSAQAAGRPC